MRLIVIPLLVQLLLGFIVWVFFAVQFWRDRHISPFRWALFAVYVVVVGGLAGWDESRRWLEPHFAVFWSTLLIGVGPDYLVEKIAGKRDKDGLTAQGRSTQLTLMQFVKGALDKMRLAGKGIEELQEFLDPLTLDDDLKVSLLDFQRLAIRSGNALD